MIWFLMSLLMISTIIFYKRLKPVKDLSFLNDDTFTAKLPNDNSIQILDIRDPMDFIKCHIVGAINIYVGRLPYVKKKELQHDHEIIILSASKYHIHKAARTLRKEGFSKLSGFVWNPIETKKCKEHQKVKIMFEQ